MCCRWHHLIQSAWCFSISGPALGIGKVSTACGSTLVRLALNHRLAKWRDSLLVSKLLQVPLAVAQKNCPSSSPKISLLDWPRTRRSKELQVPVMKDFTLVPTFLALLCTFLCLCLPTTSGRRRRGQKVLQITGYFSNETVVRDEDNVASWLCFSLVLFPLLSNLMLCWWVQTGSYTGRGQSWRRVHSGTSSAIIIQCWGRGDGRHSTNSYMKKCVWGATQKLNFAYTVARHWAKHFSSLAA